MFHCSLPFLLGMFLSNEHDASLRKKVYVTWSFQLNLTNLCFHEDQVHWVFKEDWQVFPDEGSLDLIFTLRHMDTIAWENSAVLKMSKGSVPEATSSNSCLWGAVLLAPSAVKKTVGRIQLPPKISCGHCGVSHLLVLGAETCMQNLLLQKKMLKMLRQINSNN